MLQNLKKVCKLLQYFILHMHRLKSVNQLHTSLPWSWKHAAGINPGWGLSSFWLSK